MRTVPLGRTLQRMAFQLAAVASIAALLLPVIGPLADHHFAERHPNHVHVYLGPEAPEHDHPYRSPHSHTHRHLGGTASGGIVFLTPNLGLTAGFADLAAPATLHPVVFPALAGNRWLFGIASAEAHLEGVTVSPPKRPPRV